MVKVAAWDVVGHWLHRAFLHIALTRIQVDIETKRFELVTPLVYLGAELENILETVNPLCVKGR